MKNICEILGLGNLIDVSVVTGGITNKMYKVTTDKGIYSIKVISTMKSKEIDLIEKSETIANIAFNNGVNAVCALEFNNKYIQKIDNNYILVYKWIDGEVKLTKDISLENVKKVAHEQALLHKIDINNFNKEIKKYDFNDYQKYYDLLKDNNEKYLTFFKEKYNEFIDIYKTIYDNYLLLDEKLSFVHKDLNRKNILWKNDKPYIIDWETSTVDYPSIDFFNSAWFLSNDVEKDKYYEYVKEYLSIMDINIENGVYAGIIEECNWLYFSLSRLFSTDKTEIELGKDSIESSLTEILNYYNKIPLMLEIIKDITKKKH